jgi:hypothetical protein
MLDYVDDLQVTVTRVSRTLAAVPDELACHRPSPGKWSPKEIVGHLVDSAANNHQRFVRAQFQDDLIFPGYAQDAWVSAQRYQEAPWPPLVTLWREFNFHLARVMESIPDAIRLRRHTRHNLHELAWRPVPAAEPATLDYFMRDYVGHLHHHLDQIASHLDASRRAGGGLCRSFAGSRPRR